MNCNKSAQIHPATTHTGDATQQGPLRRRTSSPGVPHQGTTGPLNQGVSTIKGIPRPLYGNIWKHSAFY